MKYDRNHNMVIMMIVFLALLVLQIITANMNGTNRTAVLGFMVAAIAFFAAEVMYDPTGDNNMWYFFFLQIAAMVTFAVYFLDDIKTRNSEGWYWGTLAGSGAVYLIFLIIGWYTHINRDGEDGTSRNRLKSE